jgi:hypothetical protein
MKQSLLSVLGVLALAPAYGGQDSYLATSQIASWEFIQSVGGIRLGKPAKTENGSWVLPVVCDVSGLTPVTHKPTAMNSGLVVTRMLYQASGSEIRISVVLNAPLSTSLTARCTEVTLSGINTGEYRVLYEEQNRSTHALGTITLR